MAIASRTFALILLLGLAACSGAGIQPCNEPARQSIGPCSVGAHHENSN
jgi:hypothetical protein